MPLLILGIIVFSSVGLYMYIFNNSDRFIQKKEPTRGPYHNVIYLPADLNAGKNTGAEDKKR